MKIGIILLATNGYFPLGIRFVKKFMHFYEGSSEIIFYFFSDKNPKEYVSENINVEHYYLSNPTWVDGTNSKFKSIIAAGEKSTCDYIFYFDADTNITQKFDENWFIGELVGGQHYADQSWMKEKKQYDRNPKSKAYVPENTTLFQMYFYGAFIGGTREKMVNLCETLKSYQEEDKKIPYEPVVNDESYINKEFHFNPPTRIVYNADFKFGISDKGGIEHTRDVNIDISSMLEDIKKYKNEVFDILNGKIVKNDA
jgi:hypothetical protein